MRKKILQLILVPLLLITQQSVHAGNPDRAGGAGCTQLLINPYGRSAGLMGSNTAYLRGAEAMQFNVAGLAFAENVELMTSRVVYLQGTDIYMNNGSVALPIGQGTGNVFGISFSSMQFGNIPITTEAQPDGTLGTYTPQVLNIGFAYAKKFSNSITAGVLVRYITEGLTNVSAQGIGLDVGVQYQTALNPKDKIKKEDFRFGIGVRNLGADMTYGGSGLSFRSVNPTTGADRRALYAADKFNLPALVNIGASYDIRLDVNPDTYYHRLTPSGNFNYMAFASNLISVGVEYAFKETFMVRGGYGWQDNITNVDFRTQYYGPSGGCTIQLPITATGTQLGLDYAYAPTRVFNGIHNITLRLVLGNKK